MLVIKTLYGDKIKALAEILMRKFSKREAALLSFIFILSSWYGAGDAMAGWILTKIKQDLINEFFRILEKRGIWRRPKHVSPHSLWIHALDIAEKADFKDKKINKALRELVDHSRTGGRYTPSFLKNK